MEPSVSGFCKMAACFKPGVTLKGLRGVANTVDVEESCVLDVESGIALIISSDRVLESKVSVLQLKIPLIFLIVTSRRSFRESTSSILPCISWIAGRSGTGKRFC